MSPITHVRLTSQRFFWCVALLFSGLVAIFLFETPISNGQSSVADVGTPVFSSTPVRIGGAAQSDDKRKDVDIYPAVAFDAKSRRYLVAWMSARQASSETSGFDVYGKLLDETGKPLGNEFRISDQNTAARGGPPAVAAGQDGFVVVWSRSGGTCQLILQGVMDSTARSDKSLTSASIHSHSPSVVYNPVRGRFVVAFVRGDDYLSPTLFGAAANSCGDNATSTSTIRAIEFHLTGDTPIVDGEVGVSAVANGAFRPKIAYSQTENRYLSVWEDRRNAKGQVFRMGVFGQLLNSDLSAIGVNQELHPDSDYTNLDDSATWTARPSAAWGDSKFLVAWYRKETDDGLPIWSLQGRFLTGENVVSEPFTISEMSFAEEHAGNAPSGFVDIIYEPLLHEFLVGMTSHLESIFGYLTGVRLQRVASSGELLRMNGNALAEHGVGTAIDYDYDAQISVALGFISVGEGADLVVLYGKHAPNQHSQDFDIWSARNRSNPLITFTPTPTATGTPTPSATPTFSGVFLPVIVK